MRIRRLTVRIVASHKALFVAAAILSALALKPTFRANSPMIESSGSVAASFPEEPRLRVPPSPVSAKSPGGAPGINDLLYLEDFGSNLYKVDSLTGEVTLDSSAGTEEVARVLNPSSAGRATPRGMAGFLAPNSGFATGGRGSAIVRSPSERNNGDAGNSGGGAFAGGASAAAGNGGGGAGESGSSSGPPSGSSPVGDSPIVPPAIFSGTDPHSPGAWGGNSGPLLYRAAATGTGQSDFITAGEGNNGSGLGVWPHAGPSYLLFSSIPTTVSVSVAPFDDALAGEGSVISAATVSLPVAGSVTVETLTPEPTGAFLFCLGLISIGLRLRCKHGATIRSETCSQSFRGTCLRGTKC